MGTSNSDILKKVLEDMEGRIKKEIQEKENGLAEVKKELYEIKLDRDFKRFMNDKSYRDIEAPYELCDKRDELEKDLRILRDKFEKFKEFRRHSENKLKN